MLKPSVFISHSTRGDQNAASVLDSLSTELDKSGFDVLLDKERLQLGDPWRRQLYFWMQQCHGAIILFSEGALKSDWVVYETTILTSRKYKEPQFAVLPILLAPVKREDLAKGPFSPMAINELHQPVREDTPDDIIKRIIEQFAPLKDCLPKSPLQKLESVITPWLKKLDRDVLLDTAEKLGVDVGVWPPDVGICSTLLARALLKGELPKVFDALRILAPQLDKNFAYNMITILAPSWVDERAVAPIPEVMRRPPKQRTVCVNGRKTFTGEMYIRRASGTFPSWSTLKVNNLSAEDQFGALMREIRAEYRKEIADDSLNDEDIDDLLNNLQEDLDPYFVVVPDYLDDEVLLKLREKYPRLTFFLLSGNQHLDTQELELKYIKFLQPALEPEQEKEAFRSYNHARAIVTSSHPRS